MGRKWHSLRLKYTRQAEIGISTVLRRFPVGAKMLIFPSISGIITCAKHREKALIKKYVGASSKL